LNKKYLQKLTENYDCEVKNMDFSKDNNAHVKINNWVAEKTNNFIKDMIQKIECSTVCLFINAIYFKAIWLHEFCPEETRLDKFRCVSSEGSRYTYEEVPMMSFSKPKRLAYFTDSKENLFFLMPYISDTDKKMSMIVMLPNKSCQSSLNGTFKLNGHEDSIKSLQQINEDIFGCPFQTRANTINNKSSLLEVELNFPKFKFNYNIHLKDTLSKIGLQRIFNPYSDDFSPMLDTENSNDSLYISDIIQQTFISVDEHGTEPALASVAKTNNSNNDTIDITYKKININRPFAFWIVEQFIGKGPEDMLILFSGKV